MFTKHIKLTVAHSWNTHICLQMHFLKLIGAVLVSLCLYMCKHFTDNTGSSFTQGQHTVSLRETASLRSSDILCVMTITAITVHECICSLCRVSTTTVAEFYRLFIWVMPVVSCKLIGLHLMTIYPREYTIDTHVCLMCMLCQCLYIDLLHYSPLCRRLKGNQDITILQTLALYTSVIVVPAFVIHSHTKKELSISVLEGAYLGMLLGFLVCTLTTDIVFQQLQKKI